MKASEYIWISVLNLVGVFLIILTLSSCNKGPEEGMTLLLQAPVGQLDQGSQLVVIDPAHPDKEPILLTEEFGFAGSAEVSFDAKNVIFEARKTLEDTWQIYEINLESLELNQITQCETDCRDPAYLPGGRVVYSRLIQDGNVTDYHVLETMQLNGSDIRQITFGPVDHRASSVLNDGRILVCSRQIHPDQGEMMLTVMRPDGTKSDLFYKGKEAQIVLNKALETDDGRVIFRELKTNNQTEAQVVSIPYNNPLGAADNLSSGIEGDFISIGLSSLDRLLVCHRSDPARPFGLFELKTGSDADLIPVYENENYDVLQASIITPVKRPRNLPSAVDSKVETALLMCQDANFYGKSKAKDLNGQSKKAVKIEVLGVKGPLGVADLEKDGSFYIKMKADTPFRLQTLDENNNLVSGPGSWMNLRPNERRACVGCHTGQNTVPENRQPLAVRKEPIEIPMYTDKIMANAIN